MIIADILNISVTLVFVAQIIVSLLLLGIVLMQRPKQEGLGAAFGAALTDQAFGARTTDVLQKGTVYLGALFMGLSFALTLLIVHRNDAEKSRLLSEQPKEAVAQQVQKDIAKPKTQTELLEELEKQAPAKDATPVAPVETPAPAAPAQPEQKAPEAPATPAAPAK